MRTYICIVNVYTCTSACSMMKDDDNPCICMICMMVMMNDGE